MKVSQDYLRALRFTKRSAHKIQTAYAKGNQNALRGAIRGHLRSNQVKTWAAYKALGVFADAWRVKKLAERIDLEKPCRGTVLWKKVPKRSGGYREICMLPHELKAMHYIVADILNAQSDISKYVFDLKGRGRDKAIEAIAAKIEEGYGWAYVGDIRSCFPSLNPDALYELPIPNNFIANAMDTRNLRFEFVLMENEGGDESADETSALEEDNPVKVEGDAIALSSVPPYMAKQQERRCPRGLMQGAPSSNLALAHFMNGVFDELEGDFVPFIVSDNLVVLARTEEESFGCGQTLVDIFSRHRAGPFDLLGEVHDVRAGFEFLGYHLRHITLFERVDVYENAANMNLFWRRFGEAIEADLKAGYLVAKNTREFVRAHQSGFDAMTNKSDNLAVYFEIADENMYPNREAFLKEVVSDLAQFEGEEVEPLDVAKLVLWHVCKAQAKAFG